MGRNSGMNRATRLLRRASGAAALEFAFAFPLLFMMSYGGIVYSYVYVLRQSLELAAQQAVAAAVSVDPNPSKTPDYQTQVSTVAVNAARSVVSWMPQKLKASVSPTVLFCPGATGTACPAGGEGAVVVRLSLPLNNAASQLFARIPLPGVGSFPPLPANMTAQAVARI